MSCCFSLALRVNTLHRATTCANRVIVLCGVKNESHGAFIAYVHLERMFCLYMAW